MAKNKGVIKLVPSRATDAYVIPGFLVPCVILVIRSAKYNIISLDNFWLSFTLVSIPITLLFLKVAVKWDSKTWYIESFVIVVISLMYSKGAVLQINKTFDNSKVTTYHAIVLGEREFYGQKGGHSSYFTLGWWGPQKKEQEVEVDDKMFLLVPIGDTVKVRYKEGLFHIPWYTVAFK